MSWLMLVLAGILEVIWSVAMKQSLGLTRPLPTAITLVTVLGSFLLLAAAMRSLPLGTAYAVWTGIGAVGAFVVGVVAFHESASLPRIIAVVLIVSGLAILRLART